MVDGMGIADNGTLLCLTENFIQFNGMDAVGANAVPQEIARSYRRQLICITYQNQAGFRTQCLQQCLHQHNINHGNLITI